MRYMPAAPKAVAMRAFIAAAVAAFAALPAYAGVKETALYRFKGYRDGLAAYSGVLVGKDGKVYGTTGYGGAITAPGCLVNSPAGCGNVFELTPPPNGATAWSESVLGDFLGAAGGGDGPVGDLLVLDAPTSERGIYGTTAGFAQGGKGSVFRLASGKLTALWSFSGGSDGAHPLGGLVADAKGVLYGTTTSGGAAKRGTVFALTPPASAGASWTLVTLWSFTGGSDGSLPQGTLLRDKTGALYGTTSSRFPICPLRGGCGTVFKLAPPAAGGKAWTLTTLWRFSGGNDGGDPIAGLVADATGALYSTTAIGGGNTCGDPSPGCGSVFKLTPPASGTTGWTPTTLWSFAGPPDGYFPTAPVVIDKTGAVYGTTQAGGAFGIGTVFKLTPPAAGGTKWSEKVLWSFLGEDGAYPYAGLAADKNGVLYGTTSEGGDFNRVCSSETFGCGVVFELGGTGFAPN